MKPQEEFNLWIKNIIGKVITEIEVAIEKHAYRRKIAELSGYPNEKDEGYKLFSAVVNFPFRIKKTFDRYEKHSTKFAALLNKYVDEVTANDIWNYMLSTLTMDAKKRLYYMDVTRAIKEKIQIVNSQIEDFDFTNYSIQHHELSRSFFVMRNSLCDLCLWKWDLPHEMERGYISDVFKAQHCIKILKDHDDKPIDQCFQRSYIEITTSEVGVQTDDQAPINITCNLM